MRVMRRRSVRKLTLLVLTGLIAAAGATSAMGHNNTAATPQYRLTGGCAWPSWFMSDQNTVISNSNVPNWFWSDTTERDDLAKIADYESCFHVGIYNGSCCYGLFQLDAANIKSTLYDQSGYWSKYFNGGDRNGVWWSAAKWEILAGDRYVYWRYGSPAKAWQHELNYGWY